MRSNNTNNQFFKSDNSNTIGDLTQEKHRIWLNLKNNNGQFSQILVGYTKNATNGMDFAMDGIFFGNEGSTLYALDHENKYTIQAKPLPFNDSERIPLGIKIVEPGAYKIELHALDGLFLETQNLYIKDNYTQKIHNLTKGAYTFSSPIETHDTRFEIIFKTDENLPNLNNLSDLKIHQEKNSVHVETIGDRIHQIEVYDLSGRKVFFLQNIDKNKVTFFSESF